MPATTRPSPEDMASASSSGSENESTSPRPSRRSSAMANGATGKRKRAQTTSDMSASVRKRRSSIPSDDQADDDDDDDEDESGDSDGSGERTDAFDPDQPIEERRHIQRGFRDLQKDLAENAEEYLQPKSRGLHETLLKAQQLSDKVKQTNEATIDSRLLVTTVDLSYRKTLRLVQGANTQGVDVDEFVSKCITYMRRGGGISDNDAHHLTGTQRRRRTGNGIGGGGRANDEDGEDDEDDEDGDDEMLDWSHLGRFASVPNLRRPALAGFLVGPLSVEKKVRKIAKRTAAFRKDDLAETRPEVLDVEDLSKKENDVTAICAKILKQLRDVQRRAQMRLQEICDEDTDMSPEEMTRLMHEHGLRDTGGVDLLRFVVNPSSFGQTVENMFYTSFLIRDGRVAIEFDALDMPTLSPVTAGDEEREEENAKHEPAKHQAIFSIDMQTWREIIDTFGIESSMIEHRKETHQQGPGARGWYS